MLQMKKQRWVWFRAVSGMRRTQVGKVPGAGKLNTAPISVPVERRKRCHQNPVGGCRVAGNMLLLSVAQSSCFLQTLPRSLFYPPDLDRRVDSLWSKVCVCFIVFIHIHTFNKGLWNFYNVYSAILEVCEAEMKKISWTNESCGLQRLHFSEGQCQIIKSKERMMLSAFQTNPIRVMGNLHETQEVIFMFMSNKKKIFLGG